MKKTFDCVQMKRRGAERVRKEVAGMTVQEEVSFWRDRTRQLRLQQKQRSAQRKAS